MLSKNRHSSTSSDGSTDFLEQQFADLQSKNQLGAPRLGDAVIDLLTRSIVDGHLAPGDPLPSESRIAESFGVSKQVAREAIRELAVLDVVQVQQGKPTRVKALGPEALQRFFRFAIGNSRKGFAEAVELRRILEPPIAELAAMRRNDEQVHQLEQQFEKLSASVGKPNEWLEADMGFHEHITMICGNRLMQFQLFALKGVIRQIAESFTASRTRSAQDWDATFDRHRRIFVAVSAGDAHAARSAMVKHFEVADIAIDELFPEQ